MAYFSEFNALTTFTVDQFEMANALVAAIDNEGSILVDAGFPVNSGEVFEFDDETVNELFNKSVLVSRRGDYYMHPLTVAAIRQLSVPASGKVVIGDDALTTFNNTQFKAIEALVASIGDAEITDNGFPIKGIEIFKHDADAVFSFFVNNVLTLKRGAYYVNPVTVVAIRSLKVPTEPKVKKATDKKA